jgi:hypothetical protein
MAGQSPPAIRRLKIMITSQPTLARELGEDA